MINLEDYSVEDISQHLPKQFDKSNHKWIVGESKKEEYFSVGEMKSWRGDNIILNNNKYSIVAVETYAVPDWKEYKTISLVLKLVQKMY